MNWRELYTNKQAEVLKRALARHWYLLINHGAIRAGKTKVNNDLFLLELRRVRQQADIDGVKTPMYIVATYSSSTLQTNILQELSNDYGIHFKFDRHGNFMLFGVKVVTTFTSTIAGLGAIRGMTSYGAYINEASLANPQVFKEIINRCSANGARIICDTNPDYPRHWLKVDYIDKADGEKIIANHFTIFDNSFLSSEYVNNIIATTPSGTFTERDIYGRWVIGEGVIYRDFNEQTMVIDRPPVDTITSYYVGVDWGYEHKGVMVVIGEDDAGNYYVVEERVHQHKHIDEWVAIAREIEAIYGSKLVFYCDGARPEYVAALDDAGFIAVNANKTVVAGISEVASLMKQGLFFVCRSCRHFFEEVEQYAWNAKGDGPIKVNDDVMDAVRYAIYSRKMEEINRPQMAIYVRGGL